MDTLYVFCCFTPWSSFGGQVFEVPVFLGKRNNCAMCQPLKPCPFLTPFLSLDTTPLQISIVKGSVVLLSLAECGWKHSLYVYFISFRSSYVYASHVPCDPLGEFEFPILQESMVDTALPCLPVATVTISCVIICSEDNSQSPVKKRIQHRRTGTLSRHSGRAWRCPYVLSTLCKENDY